VPWEGMLCRVAGAALGATALPLPEPGGSSSTSSVPGAMVSGCQGILRHLAPASCMVAMGKGVPVSGLGGLAAGGLRGRSGGR
jgi:hypothetical protein